MTREDDTPTASDGLRARAAGPWVHVKNFYVDRYLSIFARGMANKWKGKLAYVDLFAGYGCNVVRKTSEEVAGSPVLALNYDFARYVFVDLPEVLEVLKKRLANHPKSARMVFVEGDCNAAIPNVLAAVPANYLTLTFIDPTGIHIRFETIRRLARNRKVDLLMTIHFGMAIRMNLPQYQRAERAALDGFMGTTTWRDDYKEAGAISQVGRRILDRYMRQLGALGYTTVRDREIGVYSDLKRLFLYVIVLASKHPRGADYWRKTTALSPSGQRRLDLTFEE